MILDRIVKPRDIKKLNLEELMILADELRSEIIRITSKHGGHLGSNLGNVELVIAIHYVFDIEEDKLIFDVGHQSYTHKLLTGRRSLMENLRSHEGASGFPDPEESSYDHFIAGHASTSLSAALGIAKGRDLKNDKFKVLTFLGDGALSGGMIYEAMNNVSGTKDFIVILNDNQMSISKSVGAMRKYLSKLLSSKGGLFCRRFIRSGLACLPDRSSKKIENFLKNILNAFRGNNIFEEFGFQYIGPIDGHNLKDLIRIFRNVRDVASYKPVIIHAATQKGYGYPDALKDDTKLHGINKTKRIRYTDVFGTKIEELAKIDSKIICITAAMKDGTGLSKFANSFPGRFFDVGIAEEHAVTFAAGLAMMGLKPFVCIYSTFLQRSFDQIYHDVVLQNLPVRFIIDKAGLPGNDGKTHSGIYDISLLQNFPNFTIMSPSTKMECENMVEYACGEISGPLAIRFPKGEAFGYASKNEITLNSRILNLGEKTLVVFIGDLLTNIWEAVEISKTNPTIMDARCVNPFDFQMFYKYSSMHEKILILEEGVFGGLSNIIIERLIKDSKTDLLNKIHFQNVSKMPVDHSTRYTQMEANGLSAKKISELL